MYKFGFWFVLIVLSVSPPIFFVRNVVDLNTLDTLNNNGNYDTVIIRNLSLGYDEVRTRDSELVSIKTGEIHAVELFVGTRFRLKRASVPAVIYKIGETIHVKYPNGWRGFVCEVQQCSMLRDGLVIRVFVSFVLTGLSLFISLLLWRTRKAWLPRVMNS